MALLGVYVYFEGRQRASRDELDRTRVTLEARDEALRAAFELRVDAQDKSLAVVTEKISHLPTSEEFHRLTTAVTKLDGTVTGSINVMRERLDSTHHRVSRTEEFLGRLRTTEVVR